MDAIWSKGPLTADAVREALVPEHSLKDSTIRTLLRRLEDKGYVSHTVEGRTYIYKGIEQPRNIAVRAVRQIIDRFCGGSVEELLVGMVESETIDPAELKQLAAKIAKRKEAK